MNIKEEVKGCGVIIVTVVAILVTAIVVLAVVGTMGDLMFWLVQQKK